MQRPSDWPSFRRSLSWCASSSPALVTPTRLDLQGEPAAQLEVILLLGRGFIITAMLWGAAAAHVIDGRLRTAGYYLLVCAILTLFGLIHSIDPAGGLYVIWQQATPVEGAMGFVTQLTDGTWVGWQLPGLLPRLVALGYAILAFFLLIRPDEVSEKRR